MNATEKKWLVRSISLPVQECLSMPWRDFMALLHASWNQSTCLANWAAHTLRAHDVCRTPGMRELPKLAPVDLYALAFGREREGKPRRAGKPPLPVVAPQYDGCEFWAGAKIAAATLLRKVDRKYRQERGKIVWRRERRTPEYQYPYPFPVHQQAWVPLWDKAPVVNLALPGSRVSLRLRQGPEFAPQIAVFKKLVAGEIDQQELSICRQISFCPDRKDVQGKMSYRVMLRIAYRQEVYDTPDDGIAELATGADPLLTLTISGSHAWVLHALQVRNWVIEHERFLQQFVDDLKHEKRWPADKRRSLNRYRERRCEKHARRMKTFRQQAAAMVIGHAKRHRIGTVRYSDTNRSFVEKFPWYLLEQAIEQKCQEAGMRFAKVASGDVVETPSSNGEGVNTDTTEV